MAHTLTVEQAQRLLEVSRESGLGPLLHIALATGMREGELLALTWDDVDLTALTITVDKSVDWQHRSRHAVGLTKTPAGRRQLNLDSTLLEVLERQRCRGIRMQLQAPHWEDRNLVFPSARGVHLVPSGAFSREFGRLLARAGCPHIRFHDLRHTAGLFLTRSAGLVVASRILGHASPAITARFYGHAQRDDFLSAAREMGRLLSAPRVPPAEVIHSGSPGSAPGR